MPEPNHLGPPWDPNLAGIVDCRELYRGRSGSANVEGVPTYTRVFLVRTSIVDPRFELIARAPGPRWRDAYPDDANSYLADISIQPEGESPFHYKATFTYRFLDDNEKIPWRRPSVFSFSGSLASAPAFWHYPTDNNNTLKRIIVNTAGDPLSGLDRDEGEFNVTIQFNQRPPFNFQRAQQYVGAINSDAWSGGAPKTWKCMSITANRKFEVIPPDLPGPPVKVFYWETSVTLGYRNTGWDIQTWDVGFNEIQGGAWNADLKVRLGGQRRKIQAGNEGLSEPAALSQGVAKAPGVAPDLLEFRVYPMRVFTGVFEPIPNTSGAGYPYSILANYYGW
jgi:hypothetical protein